MRGSNTLNLYSCCHNLLIFFSRIRACFVAAGFGLAGKSSKGRWMKLFTSLDAPLLAVLECSLSPNCDQCKYLQSVPHQCCIWYTGYKNHCWSLLSPLRKFFSILDCAENVFSWISHLLQLMQFFKYHLWLLCVTMCYRKMKLLFLIVTYFSWSR